MQPGHGGADRVHLPVQAVVQADVGLPGDAGDEAGLGAPGRRPGVGQEEGSRAVGALGLAPGAAAFGEEGGLLVDARPAHFDLGPEGSGRADHGVVGHEGGPALAVQAEELDGLGAPGHGVEIEEQGARSGGHVGRERAAQALQQPGVGGADDAFGGQLLPEPRQLGGDEVGVQFQAGDLDEKFGVVGQAVAHGLGATVLPDDGRGQRCGRVGIPGQDGLALIGQGHGVEGRVAGAGQRLTTCCEHGLPEAFRVGLHRAIGAGVDAHRHLGQRHHLAVVTDDGAFGPRRPLVDGEDGHRSQCPRRAGGAQPALRPSGTTGL